MIKPEHNRPWYYLPNGKVAFHVMKKCYICESLTEHIYFISCHGDTYTKCTEHSFLDDREKLMEFKNGNKRFKSMELNISDDKVNYIFEYL